MTLRFLDRIGDPCYSHFKEELLRTKATQALVYHIGPTLLVDARASDDQLHLIASLVLALAKLDYATPFQQRIDEISHYCIKPRWHWIERLESGVPMKFGRRVVTNQAAIFDAERLMKSGVLYE